jgi:hypothetical protein
MRTDSKLGGRGLRLGALGTGVVAAATAAAFWFAGGSARVEPDAATLAKATAREKLAGLPLTFEVNRGQTDAAARFVARGNGATMWVTDDAAVFAFSSDGQGATEALRMRFEGASKAVPAGVSEQKTKSNYFRGGDEAIRAVPHYAEVVEKDLYPGVDLRWYGSRGRAEYDLTLAPGVDPSAVKIAMDGADELSITEKGELAIRIGERVVLQSAPIAYQGEGDARTPVASAFEIADGRVGFTIGAHDPSRAVVIDPSIYFSTFYGGAGEETGRGVAYDPVDATKVMCGTTTSIDLPLGFGHIPSAPRGGNDAYVMKLSTNADFVVFATYFGGRDYDEAFDVGIDVFGGRHHVWVCGQTFSTNFPTVTPLAGFGAARSGKWDGFVASMSDNGDTLFFSSYLGGADDDFARGLAVDSLGNGHVYVTGYTASSGFPTVGTQWNGAYHGGNDAFLAKIQAPHVAPYFGATYTRAFLVGSTGDDRAYDVAVHASTEEVYLTGYTTSSDFPRFNLVGASLGNSLQNVFGGFSDAFALRLSPAVTAVDPRVWSTFIGGSGYEIGSSIDVDTNGDVAVCGKTDSIDLPRIAAFQPIRHGPDDAFVVHIMEPGYQAQFMTYFGGGASDRGDAVAFRKTGVAPHDVYLYGTTESADLPVTAENLSATLNNLMNTDTFLARFGNVPNAFLFQEPGRPKLVTYLGGADYDWAGGMAWIGASNVLLSGTTRSPDFPSMNTLAAAPAQPSISGPTDAFLLQVNAGTTLFPAGNVTVDVRTPDSVAVAWKADTSGAGSVLIQRVDGEGVKTDVATVAPTVNQYVDTGLAPDTSYSYQVTAVKADGSSESSTFVPATTLPYPPAAPTGFSASGAGSRVSLSWTDASSNETGFQIQKSSGGAFKTVASVKAGVTRWESTQIVTGGEDAAWRVVAVNRGGSSAPSAEVSTSTQATLSLNVLKGSLLDAGTLGGDRFSASGKIQGAAGFDPNAQSLRIELGSAAGPLVLSIPAGDRGWTGRHGNLSWNSARSFVGGARFKLDLNAKKGTFALSVTGFDFPAAAQSALGFGVALGDKAGATTFVWQEKAAGKYVGK